MRRSAALAFALLLLAAQTRAQEKKDEPKTDEFPPIPTVDLKLKEPVDYNKDVLPIFENKCFVCHSGGELRGKYDMSTHDKVLKGGKRGPAVVPGKSADSNLFLFCSRQKKPMMPPKSDEPLNSKEVSLLKAWIDEGAKAPTMVRLKEKIVVNLPPALVKPVRAVAVSRTARRSPPAAGIRSTCSS